jgi:nucleoside 2-deoxyribosyltransferase
MEAAGKDLRLLGHSVKIPAFDDFPDKNVLEVNEYNRGFIEWADEVHVFWDQRSVGTLFDLGMCFALRKPIKIKFLNHKTYVDFMKQYEASFGETCCVF